MEYHEWAEKGACIDADPNIFHPEGKGSDSSRYAIVICNRCPVIDECREYAIQNEVTGVWGGLSNVQLQKERTKRNINFHKNSIIAEDYPNGFEKTT